MSGIVRLDKVKSTRVGHIYNVQSADALENGSIGYLNGLASGEKEVYAFAKYATATITTKKAVLIAHPEIMDNESTMALRRLSGFVNTAATPVRAYELAVGDIFSVSADMVGALATDVVVGNFAIATNASYKYSEIATLGGTEKFAAKIIGVDNMGVTGPLVAGNTYKYIVLEVVVA